MGEEGYGRSCCENLTPGYMPDMSSGTPSTPSHATSTYAIPTTSVNTRAHHKTVTFQVECQAREEEERAEKGRARTERRVGNGNSDTVDSKDLPTQQIPTY